MHLIWVKRQSFEQAAQQATVVDYLHEVEHAAERIARLERSIDAAIETLPQKTACGDRRAAEPARDRQDQRGVDHGRGRRAVAF